ncbi:uncharacterized protein LOC135399339 [Ornithodoros turicata]|uniref:uncharacterized protein LOC135399339 n=1 Tax=Ornithodoros turicata TaxID=34597 RepID=UPI00313A0785
MFNNSVPCFPQVNGDAAESSGTPFLSCPGTPRSVQRSVNANITISIKCGSCYDAFIFPKVLNCLHSFCKLGLERHQTSPDKLELPFVFAGDDLTSRGHCRTLLKLRPSIILKTLVLDHSCLTCTACKHTAAPAVARCLDCVHTYVSIV